MLKFKDDGINLILKQAREDEDDSVARRTSQEQNLPLMDLLSYPIEFGALGSIEESESREGLLAPFHRSGKRLFVACINPGLPKTKAILDRLVKAGNIVTVFVTTKKGLERSWERYGDMVKSNLVVSGVVSVNAEMMDDFILNIKRFQDFIEISKKILSEGKQSTTKLFEVILAGAYALKSSDIHIEPSENMVRVRFRLDGVLHDVLEIPNVSYGFFKSRLKILSGVKLNQLKEAQDGRFTIDLMSKKIEVRVSIIPGNYGESVVMRLLDPDSINVTLETLGFEPYLEKIVLEALSKPNGVILMTGPTGSGKTTTLYAMLRHIYNPELKIITVENPIEYKIAGIVQTQVDNNSQEYTFAKSVRAIMRQDPNIIMVGEIRDLDTAEAAIEFALTGHLVLSTLHTNTAAGVIPRLVDMKVNPKILGSALRLSLAQRLLRRICKDCEYEYEADDEEKKLINNIMNEMLENNKQAFLEPYRDTVYKLKKGKGCEVCNGFGYKGRLAVHEAISMNGVMEEMANTNPSEREIQKVANAQGYLTLREDALLKIFKGLTTVEEAKANVDMYGFNA